MTEAHKAGRGGSRLVQVNMSGIWRTAAHRADPGPSSLPSAPNQLSLLVLKAHSRSFALVLTSLLTPCRLPADTGLGAVNMSPFRANTLLATSFLLLACAVVLVVGQECSATKLCATGCCSAFGFCGTDAVHCGTGCLSTCDYKLGCDENNPCKDGTCCSEFGFCGLGPDCEWTLNT